LAAHPLGQALVLVVQEEEEEALQELAGLPTLVAVAWAELVETLETLLLELVVLV
jgi:hypothetical protein